MRFLLSVILIALLAAGAECFLPWWMIAVVAFVVSVFFNERGGRSFLMGFCGIGSFWLVAAMMHDMANGHILSARMAALFHLPNYSWFIVVTLFIGALVGGLSAWAGALIRSKG